MEDEGGVLFRTEKKTKHMLVHKPLDELVAMVTPANLLSCPKRQDLMAKLEQSNGLDPHRYHSIGVRLIQNLINYCQSLPETNNGYYASLVGLFDHALNRTEAAMSIFKHYILNNQTDKMSPEQALWGYALFSASLLKDCSKLSTDFIIDIFDHNGHYLTRWNPLLESMSAVGSYYYYTFQATHEPKFRTSLNILMAKMITPNSGFAWLASNLHILKIWLNLLDVEDDAGGGTLKAILSRADDIALQRELDALLVKAQKDNSGKRSSRIGTFVDVTPDSAHSRRNIGIQFVRWVQKQLAQGNLILNKGLLTVVPGGMVLSETMFKLFVKSHPEYKKWQVIYHGFISLGAHKISLDGSVVKRNDLDDGGEI